MITFVDVTTAVESAGRRPQKTEATDVFELGVSDEILDDGFEGLDNNTKFVIQNSHFCHCYREGIC